MIIDKDGQGLLESYISALQKVQNVKHRVQPRQPDDHHEAETLEDRMQGDGGSNLPGNIGNNKEATPTDYSNNEAPNNDEQVTKTEPVAPTIVTAVIAVNSQEDDSTLNMIKTDLYSIATTAMKLHDLASNGCTFDSWMLGKISICSDSLSNIHKVAEYDSKVSHSL